MTIVTQDKIARVLEFLCRFPSSHSSSHITPPSRSLTRTGLRYLPYIKHSTYEYMRDRIRQPPEYEAVGSGRGGGVPPEIKPRTQGGVGAVVYAPGFSSLLFYISRCVCDAASPHGNFNRLVRVGLDNCRKCGVTPTRYSTTLTRNLC